MNKLMRLEDWAKEAMMKIKERGRGKRKTSTITPATGGKLSIGSYFTIAGIGWTVRGRPCANGRYTITRKKGAKCVKLKQFKVIGHV